MTVQLTHTCPAMGVPLRSFSTFCIRGDGLNRGLDDAAGRSSLGKDGGR